MIVSGVSPVCDILSSAVAMLKIKLMYVGIFYECEVQEEHNLPKCRSLKVLIMILETF